jgi:hypothetical protein
MNRITYQEESMFNISNTRVLNHKIKLYTKIRWY